MSNSRNIWKNVRGFLERTRNLIYSYIYEGVVYKHFLYPMLNPLVPVRGYILSFAIDSVRPDKQPLIFMEPKFSSPFYFPPCLTYKVGQNGWNMRTKGKASEGWSYKEIQVYILLMRMGNKRPTLLLHFTSHLLSLIISFNSLASSSSSRKQPKRHSFKPKPPTNNFPIKHKFGNLSFRFSMSKVPTLTIKYTNVCFY